MDDAQTAVFTMLVVSHGMVLLSGYRFADDADISAWALLIGAIVLALTAFSLVVP